MGSVAEGTRVGLGNEIDLMVDFLGLRDDVEDQRPPFFVRKDDPFHLYVNPERDLPVWMNDYISENGELLLDKFSFDLMEGLQNTIEQIYG